MVTGLGADRETTWRSLCAGAGAVRWLDSADLMRQIGVEEGLGEFPRFVGAPAVIASPGF